jgi:hypothetical protein
MKILDIDQIEKLNLIEDECNYKYDNFDRLIQFKGNDI